MTVLGTQLLTGGMLKGCLQVFLLQIISVMLKTGKPLSELAKIMEALPQELVNVMVSEKRPIKELKKVTKMILDYEKKLAGRGRVLVRYSGTEPKARVMVEGDDNKLITRAANDIAQAIKEEIG